VLLQQAIELLFKCHFAVVPFLILNVSHDRPNLRLAYPETAVALLPEAKLPISPDIHPDGFDLMSLMASAIAIVAGNCNNI
jgi:hypothetical protein